MPQNLRENAKARLMQVFLAIFVCLSVAFMAVWSNEGEDGPIHSIQNSVRSILTPFSAVGSFGYDAVNDASDAIADMTVDEETLTALKERNAELTELLTRSEEYRLQSERLQGLLELKDTYKIDGVSAHVIGRSTDAWNQTIMLDVGSDDGVESGLSVMGAYGLIGQVISVDSSSCTVRLLTDPRSGAAAMIQSSRSDGVVRGSLTGVLHLENLDPSVSVNVGDVVLTSGLGGSYVKGLLIGTVVRIEGNASDGTRKVIVSPNEQASSLEEVIVVFSATVSTTIIKADGTGSAVSESSSESSDVNSSSKSASEVS